MKRIFLSLSLLCSASTICFACEDGHWIQSVLDDGRLIRLEDGSLWRVAEYDRITAQLWLPITDVIVCDQRIINEDDNEAVDARKVR